MVTSIPDPATLVRVQQAAERAVVVLADLEGQRTSLQAPTVQWLLKLSACHGKVGLHGVQLGSKICSPRQSPTSQCLQQSEVSGAIVPPEGDCWARQHNPLCTSLMWLSDSVYHLGPEGLVDLLAPAAQVEGQGAGGDGAPDPASAALAADVHLDLPVPRVGRIIL